MTYHVSTPSDCKSTGYFRVVGADDFVFVKNTVVFSGMANNRADDQYNIQMVITTIVMIVTRTSHYTMYIEPWL